MRIAVLRLILGRQLAKQMVLKFPGGWDNLPTCVVYMLNEQFCIYLADKYVIVLFWCIGDIHTHKCNTKFDLLFIM